jgi:hypothetical protein
LLFDERNAARVYHAILDASGFIISIRVSPLRAFSASSPACALILSSLLTFISLYLPVHLIQTVQQNPVICLVPAGNPLDIHHVRLFGAG